MGHKLWLIKPFIKKSIRYANGRFYEAEICTATCNGNLCLPNLISFASWNLARIAGDSLPGTTGSNGQIDSISENLDDVSNLIGSLTSSSSAIAMSTILVTFIAIFNDTLNIF